MQKSDLLEVGGCGHEPPMGWRLAVGGGLRQKRQKAAISLQIRGFSQILIYISLSPLGHEPPSPHVAAVSPLWNYWETKRRREVTNA